ncbi:MAG: hypothetical protein KatS3mg018_1961 [Fimbriimonadales bacterium]|nr:MAG: hypothetical protein KatS3mg018_1961 [Fimbriimonadales bacterium]
MALSQCDRAEQQQLALTVMPRLIMATPLAIPAPPLAFMPYTPLYLLPLSRSIIPRSPPPRHPSRQTLSLCAGILPVQAC